MSTRMFFCWVTLMCAVTFPSFRANSSIPSAKELNRSRPLGFQVRNWNPTETILWSLLPGSWRKLVPLKKTGNVCVSTQENVRLRWNEAWYKTFKSHSCTVVQYENYWDGWDETEVAIYCIYDWNSKKYRMRLVFALWDWIWWLWFHIGWCNVTDRLWRRAVLIKG